MMKDFNLRECKYCFRLVFTFFRIRKHIRRCVNADLDFTRHVNYYPTKENL